MCVGSGCCSGYGSDIEGLTVYFHRLPHSLLSAQCPDSSLNTRHYSSLLDRARHTAAKPPGLISHKCRHRKAYNTHFMNRDFKLHSCFTMLCLTEAILSSCQLWQSFSGSESGLMSLLMPCCGCVCTQIQRVSAFTGCWSFGGLWRCLVTAAQAGIKLETVITQAHTDIKWSC